MPVDNIAGMATETKGTGRKPPTAPPAKLVKAYLNEHMTALNVGNAELARKLGRDRASVTRWRKSDRRISLPQLGLIARALGIEPEELLRPPTPDRPSIDKILRDKPDSTVIRVERIVRAYLETED
jgi:transcriptional regulator with XRE-family HTH domain